MSGEPPFSLSDFLDEAGIDPENVDADETERINEALAELNPELYGTGGGDGGGDAGPPTLDGSLDDTEFPGGSVQEFGASISASGNVAVVGAPGTDLGDGNDEGVAQVFERSNGSFEQVATLTASQPGDRVGENVAVDGNTAIVGAPGTNSGAGEVYIYTKTGGSWSSSADFALTDADNETGIDESSVPTFDPDSSPVPFGSVVDIEGDIVVAGARPSNYELVGYNAFQRSTDQSTSDWVWIDSFVDISGGTFTDVATDSGVGLLINQDSDDSVFRVFPTEPSPPFDDYGPGNASGGIPSFGTVGDITDIGGSNVTVFVGAAEKMLVFEQTGTQTVDSVQIPTYNDESTATLNPSSGISGAGFGTSSVAADGTDVVVGAPGETTSSGTGVVYQFKRSGGSWGQNRRITAPSGVSSFGTSLSLGPNTIYVGDGNNVYTFAR